MSNLLDRMKNQIGPVLIEKIAFTLGVNEYLTRSAVDSFIPVVLSGIIDQGSTRDGAGNILSLIADNNLGSGMLDNMGDLLGGGSKTDTYLKMGAGLISTLYGRNESGLIDKVLSVGGLSRSNSGKLLSILAPIALSVIGKLVNSKDMDAGGLLSYLQREKSDVKSELPAGFSTFSSAQVVNTNMRAADKTSGGGMGWLKWLIPLLILGGLVWYLICCKGCGGSADISHSDQIEHMETSENLSNVNTIEGEDHTGSDHIRHDQSTTTNEVTDASVDANYRIDPSGHIIDQYGFIVYSADEIKEDEDGNIVNAQGTILVPVAKVPAVTVKLLGKSSPKLSIDIDGNLVDASGKILFKKGEFSEIDGYYVDKAGNRLGFFEKVGKTIGDAAEATADAFKSAFITLFSKADAVGSTYHVSRMDFNKENHRLTYYSKQEFEGLVKALNAYPNKSLEVRVYTDDGENEKENKRLSDARANVVRDMLTTLLGTKKDQVSYKGMGSEDASKAASDVVEIFIAK